MIDIFDAVGLKKPDISILSDEFLAEVKRMPHKNLAFELLRKLLNDEIKTRSKKNLRREKLNLNEEELAFYDALEVNDSAVKVLGDEKLTIIARELVDTVRKNVTIDWTLKESVQAKLRVMVKRILKKYGYPPDKQKKATETVLEQAKLICKDLAEV